MKEHVHWITPGSHNTSVQSSTDDECHCHFIEDELAKSAGTPKHSHKIHGEVTSLPIDPVEVN